MKKSLRDVASAKSRRPLQRRAPSPLALEARLMFDGAAVDTAVAVAAAIDHPLAVESAVDVAIKDSSAAVSSAPAIPVQEAPTAAPVAATALSLDAPALRVIAPSEPAAAAGRNEVVFVDPVVANWPSLVEQIRPGIEVVLLDGNADGLYQIAEYLDGRQGIDAIHILGHGEAGQLDLGSSHLDANALASAAVTNALRDIGSHLGADGDILLYGCDVGASTDGAAFVTQLAALTSADLAASSDDTGSASLGGNWTLELQTGSIEARSFDLSSANSPAFLLGAPTVSSVDDRTYNEGDGAVVVDSNITITGGTSYDGKYIRFSLTNGQTTDILSLTNAANVNASGAISFSGASVYLGNGSSRDVIGTIDAIENGLNGQALKINFVSTFTNSSFESGITGWTAMNQMIDLGSTSIAGFTSPNDTTNPSGSGGNDNDVPTSLGTLQTVVSTTQATDGTKSLQLASTGMTTRNGYDVVHGPAVYSDVFAAVAGDAIYFDWRALAGSDAYDVYGYLLNTATGVTTKVLDATGTSSSGTTNWATASASIPTTGNYRFVFVSGTYDFSGGRAAGASLYIDNVRVFGSRVNDAVVTSIARQVTFNATSDSPETSPTRVFTVTALSSTNQSSSDTGLINITTTNDAPTLTGAPQTLTYTENANPTAIDTQVVVADPDLPANFNGGYLEVQITANGAAEDSLSVINQGTAAGQIGVSGSNVTYGGTVIGVIDPTATGAGNTVLRVALNANATAAATQALARAIGYSNSSDAPSVLSRTVAFRLNDGGNRGSGSALTATRNATVNVTPVDDPTVLNLTRSNAGYSENDTSFYVDPNLTLNDVDSATLNGAKVIIAANFRGSEDQLIPASGTNGNGITFAYDATKGVLTLSGTATIAQYQDALRSVRYNNTSERPDTTPRTITITLGNVVALTINGINHYYEVVTGPATWSAAYAAAAARTFQGLTGYLATLTSLLENDFVREKLTADAWIGLTDDFARINAAVGSTLYVNQAASEGHFFWVSGPEAGSRVSDGNTNPVTASGSFAYWNTGEPNNAGGEHYGEIYSTGASPGRWNDLPNASTLAYVVEYSDQGGVSDFNKSLTISPIRVNDAPVIAGTVAMTSINEDATSNAGQLVSSFMSGATDVDGDTVTGIAITSLNASRGTWQYSLDNGASWSNSGAVSTASALLLRTTDRVRFVPDGLNSDTASLTYKAWDRSNENASTIKAGVKIDATTAGDTTAYSTGAQTANLNVTAINDAPTLGAASPALTTISEDGIGNGGQTVASFLGATIGDSDSGAQQGIAITSLASGAGAWEYSTNGGSSWTAVGTVSSNSALLLRDTDLIRMQPNGQNGGSATFNYRAWDRSAGTQGTKVDTSINGGTSAFSTAANSASITVTSVNDAPVLSGAALTLAGINEDNINSAGQTVASFLGSTLTDVDSGAVAGIAITAQTVPGTGHWEYDAGSGWTTLGAVAPGSAVLLRATDRVRFVPDQQFGGTATLTVRGWDTTTGTAGTTADTTTNGGVTAFSTVTATASLAVTEVNDPPAFNTAADASSYTELDVATTVGANLVLSDDGGTIKGATVRIATGFNAGDVLAVATPGSLTVNYNASTGVLTLSGTASAAVYQAALRSVTFNSTSDDPTVVATTRTLQWQATDATNLASAISSSTLTITPTADAPVLGTVPAAWNYTEDDGTRVLAPSLTLSDADDAYMSGATVTIAGTGYLTDGRETLAANTIGTGITANFDALNGVLTLSGTDSAANYQRVLRSVTYTNTADYENGGGSVTIAGNDARTISWEVTDANSDGAAGAPPYAAQVGNATTNVTILNANETPQVNNVNGNSVHIAYTEGGSPATLEGVLDVEDDGLVSTIDSAFVRVTTGLAAGDELGFFSGVTGWVQAGTDTVGTLTKGATVISYAWSLADGEMHLTTTGGTADQTDYTEVMQSIGYVTTSDDPTSAAATRTLIWRVTDSGGLQSAVTAAQTTIIDITAVNDLAEADNASLPAGGDIVYTENGPVVTLAPSLSMVDPDDTELASATVSISGAGFSAANEYLSLPGATVIAGSDWVLANVGGTGIAASYDAASGTLTLSGAATFASYQDVLRQVGYGSADNHPTATATTRTISWTLTDQFGSRVTDVPAGNDGDSGGAGNVLTSSVTLLPLNDAPTLGGLGGNVGYTDGGAVTTLAAGLTLADVDDVNLSQAQVRISAGFTAGDTLAVAVPGSLVVNYNSTTGVLTLSGVGSKAEYATALQSVTFASSSANPTAVAPSRTFAWQITDNNAAGDGALTSAIGTTTLDITATDAPAAIAGLPAGGSIVFAENGSPVDAAPSLTLSDADDTQLAGATIAISAGATAGDLLQVNAALAGTGISVDGSSTATSLVLTGVASIADYQNVLRSISFSSSSDHPTGTATTRTISWTTTSAFSSRLTDANGANDASAGATSSAYNSQVTITPLNDAPTLAFNDGTPGDSADTPVFEQGGSALFVISSLTPNVAGGITVADADDTQLGGASVVITSGLSPDDILSVATPAGWNRVGNVYSFGGNSITAVYNSGTGTLSFTGTAARTAYETLLGNVQYLNNSSAPTSTGASRALSWTVQDANSAGDGARSGTGTTYLTIRDRNDSPTILPINSTASYTEGEASVALPDVVITDPDPGEVVTATLTLSSTTAGSLSIPAGASYDVGTGVWTITGTVADVNAALAAVQFLPQTNNDAAASISVSVTDGGEDSAVSASGSIALNVTAVNDAPVLTPVAPVLGTISEDDVNNAGYLVSSFRGVIADVDTGTTPGIVITALVPGNGHWEYSLNGGTTWITVSALSDTNALLLRDTDRVRFVPNGSNGTTAEFTYRAWDGSGAAAAGTLVNASNTGNAEPFSSGFDVASLTVTSANDSPVLANVNGNLSAITENAIGTSGHLVADLLTGLVADVDTGALQGLAVTALNAGNGVWQYSLDAGTTWVDVTNVSASNALLLSDTDRLRLRPDTLNATVASFNYRAWDRSAGTAGSFADVAGAGANSPFSSVENTITQAATAVNDAPVLQAGTTAMTPLNEDYIVNLGATVATILGGRASDVDTGAVQGIAVIGTNDGNGRWQYSLDNGVTWTTMAPFVVDTGLLLRDSDRVRFLPNSENATTASFEFRAWDQTSGAVGTVVSTALKGDDTAFSIATNTATIIANGLNDSPVMTPDTPALPTLNEDEQDNTGVQVSTMLGTTVSDVDVGSPQGIAITGFDAGNGRWQYSLDDGMTWVDVGSASTQDALLLRATDRVRLRPDAQNATTANFTYRAWDQSDGTAGGRLDTSVSDVTSSWSLQTSTATIAVTAVNDAPINDVLPTDSGARRIDGTLRQDGVLTADPQLWHDVDAGDPPVSFRYQWEIADDADGTNLRVITGATASQYSIVAGDIGKYIRVTVYGSDGQVETPASSLFTRVSNEVPVASQALDTQQVSESVPFTYTVPASAFTDANGEDTLYYTATLTDGSPLPAWLSFDPITRTFSGTPGGGDVAVLSVRVTASDHGLQNVSSDFTLRVLALPVNLPDAPPPAPPPAAPLAPNVDLSTPITVTDGAALVQTSGARALSGDLSAASLSNPYQIQQSVEPLTSAAGFRVPIDASPVGQPALALSHPLTDQYNSSEGTWRFTIPTDTFTHTQRDAIVDLQATRVDGTQLPSWLRFDARTGQFFGDPPNNFEGVIELKVTARDNFGNEVSTIFRIHFKKSGAEKAFIGRSDVSSQFAAQLQQRSFQRDAVLRPVARVRVAS